MIKVTVEREKRLKAITELSIAIRMVAEALSNNAQITISNNVINASDQPAISIDAEEDVNETMIFDGDVIK